jgi:hypothetical protein
MTRAWPKGRVYKRHIFLGSINAISHEAAGSGYEAFVRANNDRPALDLTVHEAGRITPLQVVATLNEPT